MRVVESGPQPLGHLVHADSKLSLRYNGSAQVTCCDDFKEDFATHNVSKMNHSLRQIFDLLRVLYPGSYWIHSQSMDHDD